MLSTDELITALRKGRELRPVRWNGNLFHGTDAACALGAIAIGLGYVPKPLDPKHDFWDENDGYIFIEDKVADYNSIWQQNDACWYGRKEIRNSDEETERFLLEGTIMYPNDEGNVPEY